MTLILGSGFSIDIPFENIENFNPDSIANSIEDFIQSNDIVTINEAQIKVTTIYKDGTIGHLPSLKYKSELNDLSKFLKISTIPTSFYEPNVKGCFFLALSYRILASLENVRCPKKNQILTKAKALANESGIAFNSDIGYTKIEEIEKKLKLRFVVLKSEPKTQTLEQFFLSKDKDVKKPLVNFLLHKECFYTFTSFRNILRDRVYGKYGGICIHCNEIIRNYTQHVTTCIRRCNACYFPISMCTTPTTLAIHQDYDSQGLVNCTDCHRSFLSQTCFENHKKDLSAAMISSSKSRGATKNFTICGKVRMCTKCKAITSDLNNHYIKSRHECTKIRCSICDISYDPVEEEHICYIQPKSFAKSVHSYSTTVYYDCETILNRNPGNN